MTGLKGLRLLVVGAAMFFCVGVAEPKVDGPGPLALSAQVQAGANPDLGEDSLESIIVAPFAKPSADAPIPIRQDTDSASWAVTGNGGEPLDVPANRGFGRRIIRSSSALVAAAAGAMGSAATKAVAKGIETGIGGLLKGGLAIVYRLLD